MQNERGSKREKGIKRNLLAKKFIKKITYFKENIKIVLYYPKNLKGFRKQKTKSRSGHEGVGEGGWDC